jgi:prolipoprotein diacylglyceryltransferase
VQISPVHRVPGYENYGTFQPVFLYQSLWDAALGLGVIWAARRLRLTGDRTFMLCAAGYAAGAFWLESLRIGPGPRALGLRYGAVSDLVVFVLSVVVLYLTRSRPSARTPLQPDQVPVVDDSSGNVIST